jgi:hypothetical protein
VKPSQWLQRLQQPASNVALARVIVLMAALVLLAAGLSAPGKAIFLPVVSTIVAGTTAILYVLLIAPALRAPDSRQPNADNPSVLVALLIDAGFLAGIGAFAYLALASSGLVMTRHDFATSFLELALTTADPGLDKDEVLRWGLIDKRPLFFAYLLVGSFAAYYWLVMRLADGWPSSALLPFSPAPKSWHTRLAGLAGALIVGLLAYGWVCIPALRAAAPPISDELAPFHNIHNYVHLSGLEQIRSGALPFVEAQTQYGLGNQVLMYLATTMVHFSAHGFYAASTLIDVGCVVVFFIFLQRMVGTGWTIAALVGWLLLPSPAMVIDRIAGGDLLTRWFFLPLLSLGLARLLLGTRSPRHLMLASIAFGAVWGLGGFLSQENLSGGVIVLALSLALLAAPSALTLRQVLSFGALFIISGVVVDGLLTAAVVGPSQVATAFVMANQKPGLVVAGVTGSWWSDPLALSLSFNALNGIFETGTQIGGAFDALIETYAEAVLLVLVLALLARTLACHHGSTTEQTRQFLARFTGVAVGAFVLHSFALLRSDVTHLSAPSFLMPLFLAMLPVFAWRCLDAGGWRKLLIATPILVLAMSAPFRLAGIGQALASPSALWNDSRKAVALFEQLRQSKGLPDNLVNRYSPLSQYQTALRQRADFDESQELVTLLHNDLQGRRLELSFYRVNALLESPELFYFYGAIRSISGITSPMTTLWLRSEEEAWIHRVAAASSGCVLLAVDRKGGLAKAWQASMLKQGSLIETPIVGSRAYGTLACKSSQGRD